MRNPIFTHDQHLIFGPEIDLYNLPDEKFPTGELLRYL